MAEECAGKPRGNKKASTANDVKANVVQPVTGPAHSAAARQATPTAENQPQSWRGMDQADPLTTYSNYGQCYTIKSFYTQSSVGLSKGTGRPMWQGKEESGGKICGCKHTVV